MKIMKYSSFCEYSTYQLIQVNVLLDNMLKNLFISIVFYNLLLVVFWIFEKFIIEYISVSSFAYSIHRLYSQIVLVPTINILGIFLTSLCSLGLLSL